MSIPESVFIGCRVKIISKANIRYEGDLFSIGADENQDPVLTLSKVMSFGTEDRPCERPVGPRTEVYQQIAFRGRDLVDLQIIKPCCINDDPSIVSAELESKPVQTPKTEDDTNALASLWGANLDTSNQKNAPLPSAEKLSKVPAFPNFMSPKPPAGLLADIPSTPWGAVGSPPSEANDKNRESSSANSPQQPPRAPAPDRKGFPAGDPQPQREAGRRIDIQGQRGVGRGNRGFRQTFDNNHQMYGQRPKNGNYGDGYRPRGSRQSRGGGYHQRPRNYGGGQGDTKPEFKSDYDIEKANAELAEELEKLDVEATSAADSEQGDTASRADEKDTYDSSKSFFDTLSSEIMDRAQGVVSRRSHREDRRQNVDTFGPSANRVGYGNYRGGGGHRGRRGGGYRGGYHNEGGGHRYRNQAPMNNTHSMA